jgi:glycosyltransferase involved in cell wall biosynthesis
VNGGMIRYINILNQLAKYTSLTVMTFANSAEIEILINEFPILNDVNFISINNEEETPFSLLPKKIAVAIYGRVLSGRMFKQSNGVLLSIFPKLNSLLNHSQFDIVIYENLASLDIARKIKSKYPKSLQIYDAHNFDTELALDQYKINEISLRNYLNIKKTEAKLGKYIDVLWTCSDREKKLFQDANKNLIAQIDIIPNGAVLPEIKVKIQEKGPKKLLFVGSLNYSPNDIGLQWLIASVLPKISQNFKLQIIGSGLPSIELIELIQKSPSIEFLGFVESLESYYENTDIVVIPILTGSGTRLKALEAMSYQCAIISTSKGVEGLEITDQVIIRETPIEFANTIDEILLNSEQKVSLGIKARKLIADRYSWDIIGKKIFKSISSINAEK